LTHQYASLALSHLHYSFHHYSSAVTSIQETIKIAQQNKDTTALRFAMEILHKIIENKAPPAATAAAVASNANSGAGSNVGANVNLLHRCLITQSNAAGRIKKSSAPSSSSSSALAAAASFSNPLPHLDASNSLMMAKMLCVRMSNSQQLQQQQAGGGGGGGANGMRTNLTQASNQPREVWKAIDRGKKGENKERC
jgi:hypothetical protein